MVNESGDRVASGLGNLQMVETRVVSKGNFNDYMDKIEQSYELGFTPFILHTNTDMVHLLPPLCL